MLIAVAAASALLADGHQWWHRRINSYTFEIIGPARATDAARMMVADRLCPKTGWESDSAVELIDSAHKLKWRIVCRAK